MKSKIQLGYCCINLTLQKDKITTNRGMIKKTFKKKGLSYVSELIQLNLKDLIQVLHWNEEAGIKVYRMSSSMFPWMSEYELRELPDFDKISELLSHAGRIAMDFGQRLSFHPGPFNVLGSPNPDLVNKTIKELDQHAEIMDLMGLDQSRLYPINIHCNGVYGDKKATLQRWCTNFTKLSKSAQLRLVVENDDRLSMYSVVDLVEGIFNPIKVPVTFDYHHHRLNPGLIDESTAFHLATITWNYHNIKPLFHYSSSRKIHEDTSCRAQAHADYVYEKINTYDTEVDIELEVKAKDIALFKYLKESDNLLETVDI